MQSGRARTHAWVLDFEPKTAKQADPLMGWAGSPDTEGQVQLNFATQDDAIAYAKRRGIDYMLEPPESPTLKPRSYADNFRYDRVR